MAAIERLCVLLPYSTLEVVSKEVITIIRCHGVMSIGEVHFNDVVIFLINFLQSRH